MSRREVATGLVSWWGLNGMTYVFNYSGTESAAKRVARTDIGIEPCIFERIEASIMIDLYKKPSPICDVPDRDMQLLTRWNSENMVLIRNNCTACIHGLPAFLEI